MVVGTTMSEGGAVAAAVSEPTRNAANDEAAQSAGGLLHLKSLPDGRQQWSWVEAPEDGTEVRPVAGAGLGVFASEFDPRGASSL